MAWLKRDCRVLGLLIKRWDGETGEPWYQDVHVDCVPRSEKAVYQIEHFYGVEDLIQRQGEKLICDSCGKLIATWRGFK